jgi:hypothetical protein
LKSKHNLDITHRIQKVRNWSELPLEFGRILRFDNLTKYLVRYGEMYYLKGNESTYLTYKRDNRWFYFNNKGVANSSSDVYKDLEIPKYLGLDPDELYEIYNKD